MNYIPSITFTETIVSLIFLQPLAAAQQATQKRKCDKHNTRSTMAIPLLSMYNFHREKASPRFVEGFQILFIMAM
jgi:hypothetical protein